ncbi:MAG: peptide chain release factor N(5)-glutamine methyltransferase [Methanosarcina sp.]|nr:peptide chain release factor N(5)-glutamine methyltransferase [Methanosarcina sp.]
MDIRDIILREKDISMNDVLGIISFVCATTKEKILADMSKEIEHDSLIRIEKFMYERKKGKPLAYITEKKEFYSQDFFVNNNVLVPRPETEVLVEKALNIINKRKDITKILDMGTGSGIIGLTIAGRTKRRVICVDISEEALSVARKNALVINAGKDVDFLCSNLFAAIKEVRYFDMILANLPYVPDEEWNGLMPDVRDFEPRRALCGGKDGVEIYREFLRHIHTYLKNEGYVLCEVGGSRQACLIKNLLDATGFSTTIESDYSGEERVVIGSWKNLS